MVNINNLYRKAVNSEARIKKFFTLIKKRRPADLDEVVWQYHDEVFADINCLECASCCRSISPILNNNDLRRMARALGMNDSEFSKKYVCTDEDGDYVFNTTPCLFLGVDNYCRIYENRPKACREYPHTDRKNMLQALDTMLKNRRYCPAVYEITEKIKRNYQ